MILTLCRLALRYHPDKIALTATKDATSSSGPSTSAADLQQRFQQINYAYTVLSDEKRRKRYDDTGRTDEGMDDVDWTEWVKDFGKIDADKLDKFKKEYQHSDEERQDLLDAYVQAEGSLEEIFTLVPCSEVLADEQRFVQTINAAIKAGDIDELPGWKKSTGDEGGRKKMRVKAQKEASEAEEYAKELGVWDELFGGGAKKGKKATDEDGAGAAAKKRRVTKGKDEEESEVEVEGDVSSDEEEATDGDEDEEDEQPKRKARKQTSSDSTARKGKAKASSSRSSGKSTNGASSSSTAAKGKGKSTASSSKKPKLSAADKDGGEGDLAGLEALFAKRQAQRSAGFDDMIARMEARAKSEGSGSKKGKGAAAKSKKAKGEDDDDDDVGGPAETEPDEEAFLKARAAVDARKAAGGGAGSSSSASGSKKKRGGK